MMPTIVVSDAPTSGDSVWVESPNTPDCHAWSAKPGQHAAPLAGITSVDVAGDTFTVHGDRRLPGSIHGLPQPWSCKVKRDAESMPDMLRGTVVE